MQCPKCGTEYNGNFCPQCGAAANVSDTQNAGSQQQPPYANQQQSQPPYQQPPYAPAGSNYAAPGTAYCYPVSIKDYMTTLLLCIFLGTLGIHRFYVGKTGTGILYLFTWGLFGIGWLVDVIQTACGNFTDKAGLPIKQR